MRCQLCNNELDEFIFHEGARDEPPTVRYECPACGPVESNEASVFDEGRPNLKRKGVIYNDEFRNN